MHVVKLSCRFKGTVKVTLSPLGDLTLKAVAQGSYVRLPRWITRKREISIYYRVMLGKDTFWA